MEIDEYTKIVQELQAIGQTGLAYTRDQFDRQRFEAILELAAKMLASTTQASLPHIRNLIMEDKGYRTPKVDVRGAIFRDGKVLLVREKSDGRWTLPGGWADLNESPRTAVERELLEETGLQARAIKLAAVHDINRHQPGQLYHTYKLFFICEAYGGQLRDTDETDSAQFFKPGKLPELSTRRVTLNQVQMCFSHHAELGLPTEVD